MITQKMFFVKIECESVVFWMGNYPARLVLSKKRSEKKNQSDKRNREGLPFKNKKR